MTDPERFAYDGDSPSAEPISGAVAWVRVAPPRPPRRRLWLHALLLVLTLVTTTAVGGSHWLSFIAGFQPDLPPFTWPQYALNGLWYALTILAILGAHEAGHYLACRYYGVDATLPYFLPVPLPLTGTAGAFIKIQSPITSKRVLFDVGIAGPLAGFLVMLPALFAGVRMSTLLPVPPDFTGVELGEPLLFQAAAWLVWGDVPDTLSLNLHPMAFAAWFGMLATALNLIPIGQFDGGHITYAVLGRHARWVTVASALFAIALSVYSSSWIVWTILALILLWRFGWQHPPTWDDHVPLDPARRWLALVALVVLVLCFTPAPISPLDLVSTP